jgi:hypothetical protein
VARRRATGKSPRRILVRSEVVGMGDTMTKTPLIIGGGGGCERKMNGWMRDGQRHGNSDGAGACGKTLSP